MKDFDINLAPGAVRVIHIQADYVYYRAGSAGGADASIEFAPQSGGESVFLYPGQAYRLPERMRGMGFAWSLKNRKGEATIIGAVIVGEGAFEDNRISGSVEVIDGGKSRTLGGQAFMGVQFCSALAGEYPHVQLFNPGGTGKRLILKQLFLSSSVAQQLVAMFYHTALAGAPNGPSNKLPGGAVSVAQMRAESNAALLSNGGLVAPYLGANGNVPVLLTEPIILNPGCGLIVRAGVQASAITATFEHIEEAI